MAILVMVVDDSKLARIVAGKAIAALQPDWERVEAANADEAVALIAAARRRRHPDRLQHARP